MGVTGLWSILSELCDREPLLYLSGKRVAVDLSGWVVQATQCKPLSTSKNPHLRNLFFRVSCLLQNGVRPIFVLEGKPPALKEVAFKKRNHAENQETKNNLSRSNFDRILKQCQDLLDCLGVPCIKSSGEAEALCAFLCLNGIVDGVITEDNDAFLYGADVVFRDFSIDPKDAHVNVYNLKSCKNKWQLNRRKLVALALLLGCDYSKGVPGVGKEAALKLLSELNDADLLQRFQEWKTLDESKLFPGYLGKKVKKLNHCNRCDHLGSASAHKKAGCALCNSTITCYLNSEVTCPCPWHISNETSVKQKAELKIYDAAKEISDFPNSEVIDEYLYYSDQIPDSEALVWKCPNLQSFQEKAFNYLGWTNENSLNKCLPLITSWQLYSLCNKIVSHQMIFEPIKIVKERVVKGEDYLEILWELKDIESNTDLPSENLCTVEHLKLFSEAYPDVTKAFFDAKIKEKEAKMKPKAERQQRRKRTMKEEKDTRKMTDYFTPVHQSFIQEKASSSMSPSNSKLLTEYYECNHLCHEKKFCVEALQT
ncbi:flap endonuclease GEN homolog 1-like [Uloborus diversus]|uniref:flap endonuclease GEN homolog 1-like n=1 Tax=Uloborus diversus TaxID=327109 RepID=UPI002409C66E|nr:flap endonuclease GEN homolog 1-like [Uloborus diversus]